jgi:DNA polymerase III epsilon subunit-like protein
MLKEFYADKKILYGEERVQQKLPSLQRYSLSSLLEHFQLPEPKHQAASDVQDLKQVLTRICEKEQSLEEFLLTQCTSSKRADKIYKLRSE